MNSEPLDPQMKPEPAQLAPDPAPENAPKPPSRAGIIFRQICGAGFYFTVYFAVQLIASFIMGFCVSFAVMFEMMAQGNGALAPDFEIQMTERMMEMIAQWTVPLLIITQILTLFLYWLIFKIRKRSTLKETGIAPVKPAILPIGILLGATASALVQFIFAAIPFPESWMNDYGEASSSLTDTPLPLLIIASVLLAPILEEIVFRGLVYTRLRRVLPLWLCVIIVSALFGLMHGNLVWFLYTSLLSALLIFLLEKTGSLLTPILVHFGFNLCGVLLPYLLGEAAELYELILLAVIGILGTAALTLLAAKLGTKEATVQAPTPEA